MEINKWIKLGVQSNIRGSYDHVILAIWVCRTDTFTSAFGQIVQITYKS